MLNFHNIFFFFLTLFLSLGLEVQANIGSNYWVYQIIETENSYEIIRVNAIDNTIENVTSILKTPTFNLSSILPEEELASAEEWFTGSVSTPIEAGIPTFAERPPNSFLSAIVPSPDGTQLAITISYSLCPGQTGECFGVTHILIHDINSGQQTVLWELPMNANTGFFPACNTEFFYTSAREVRAGISRIQWLPDGSALVAQIRYMSYNSWDYPLVIIPIDAPENAFIVGGGEADWIIFPDSGRIASVLRYCDESLSQNHVVSITEFDLENNQHSFQIYPRTPDIMSLPGLFNPVILQNQLVFPVQETHPNVGAVGAIYRLGLLDFTRDVPMSLLDGDISSVRFIRSSPSNTRLIVQDFEGL